MLLILLGVTEWISSGITVTAERFNNLPYDVRIIKIEDVSTISSLGELLEKKAGIRITKYGSPGGLSQVLIRGSSPSHALILLNGHRINDPRTGGFDLSAIPLNSVSRVEIIKGPSSVLLGSNASGGIVNFVTEAKENHFKMSGNSLPGFLTDIGGKRWDLSGNLHIDKGRGDRNNTDYERYSTSLGWKGFNLLWTYRKVGLPGPMPDKNFIPEFGDAKTTNLYDHQHTKLLDGSYQKRFGIGDFGLLLSPSIRWERMEPSHRYKDYFSGDTIDEDDNYTTLVAQLDAKVLYKGITLSLHLEQDSILMHQFKSSGDTVSWYAGERNAGISISSSSKLWMLNLFGSLRGDWFRSFGFHPSVSLGLRSTGLVNTHLSIGTAFRAPTLNDLYWPLYSNESLSPEYSTGLNAGIGVDEFSLSAYIKEIADRIGYGSDWKPYNIYRSRIYGVDVGYRGEYKALSYSVSYSYMDGYDDLDSLKRDLQYQPEHSFSGILAYEGPVRLEISGNWVGERKKWFSYPGEWKKEESYLILDASVEKIFADCTIGIGVENILDRQYMSHFGYTFDDRDYPGLGRHFLFWLALK